MTGELERWGDVSRKVLGRLEVTGNLEAGGEDSAMF